MKRKILIGILCGLTILLFSACGSTETSIDSTENSISEEMEMTQEEVLVEERNETDVDKQESVGISVYYSEDAMTFSSEIIQLESLTIENVMNAMVNKGIISSNVLVQEFETKDVDGKKTIELDLNKAFSNELSQKGSTGEYYTLGSICNTVLEAFECEQIKITVDKQELSTGHMEYDGYLQKFKK